MILLQSFKVLEYSTTTGVSTDAIQDKYLRNDNKKSIKFQFDSFHSVNLNFSDKIMNIREDAAG